ncbi:MAG: LytTR family DNA-binding domain-containing protein [Bacteroidetes bacterium]|nr:LytTR family DNA-binding domain-containing protein [Bacteroidota bacterium]
MKVVVVEPDKKVAKKMIRMLYSIDKSIDVLAVLSNMPALLRHTKAGIMPDLVLINRNLISHIQQSVEAKLIIPGGQTPLVYLAYRINNLKHLEKQISNTKSLISSSDLLQHVAVNNYPLANTPASTGEAKKRFLVSQQRKFLSIPVEEIAYFFSDNRFIFFTTFSNKKYLIEYRMDELENLLDMQEFFRINRSYLVSIRSIISIQPYPGNRFRLSLNPASDKEIIVSRERLPAFRAWLGE